MITILMERKLVKKMSKVMTPDQVAATRMRILQMIHPDWNVKKKQVGSIFQQKKQIKTYLGIPKRESYSGVWDSLKVQSL